MMGHKIRFYGEIWILTTKLCLLPILIWSTEPIVCTKYKYLKVNEYTFRSNCVIFILSSFSMSVVSAIALSILLSGEVTMV